MVDEDVPVETLGVVTVAAATPVEVEREVEVDRVMVDKIVDVIGCLVEVWTRGGGRRNHGGQQICSALILQLLAYRCRSCVGMTTMMSCGW